MTPASLEALARALVRLEPSVFSFAHNIDGPRGFHYSWLRVNVDGFFKRVIEMNDIIGDEYTVDDDRLFDAVWRCAVAREWNCTVWNFYGDVSAKIEFHAEIDPVQADAATPGVALALAYCAACGDIVEG